MLTLPHRIRNIQEFKKKMLEKSKSAARGQEKNELYIFFLTI